MENLTFTGVGTFAGTGNAQANIITGGTGDDFLIAVANTGGGGDTLIGGAGNDVYTVVSIADSVVENPGQGTDRIMTALSSYTLGTNLEDLTYTGAANFTGTGNANVNIIIGGAGNDTLDGGLNVTGVDRLSGGSGNDTYVVRNVGDVILESAGGGTDLVLAAISTYTLAGDVENLTFMGTSTAPATTPPIF